MSDTDSATTADAPDVAGTTGEQSGPPEGESSTGVPAQASASPGDAPRRAAHGPVRYALTATVPGDEDGSAARAAAALAADGAYVLLAVPAESRDVTTDVVVTANGVVRTLRVPVDADKTAELAAAQSALTTLRGDGFAVGLRRHQARRKLQTLRRKHRIDAVREGEAWQRRCAQAYAPYIDAFAPAATLRVGETPAVKTGNKSFTGPVLGIGPSNTAAQAAAWGSAVTEHLDGVRAQTFMLASGNTYGFPHDRTVSTDDWLSKKWQLGQLSYVLDTYTHLLAEGGMPPLGRLNGTWADGDLTELQAAGLAVALVFHGNEIRDPSRHRARVPFSPFNPRHELTHALQTKVDRLLPVVREMAVPKFVSTPDLLADLPGAVWLPVTVDAELWSSDAPLLERERPVVVHATSNPYVKGTAWIEPMLLDLHKAKIIDYRRIKGVPHADLPGVIADADIVLDQFALGTYGPLSCQAMAAGRVTVSYLHDSVTSVVGEDLPIFNADPDNLRETLLEILAERDAAREQAARGPEFIGEYHDGRRAAKVLSEFLTSS